MPHNSSMRNTIIYALVESDTGQIRYVGKTNQPLKDRLARHLTSDRGTHRCNWIKSVLARSAEVQAIILEELPPDVDWQAAERRWIAMYREAGARLVNSTDGGEGLHNPTDELRAKLRLGRLGKKMPPEVVERHRKMMTGSKRTPEQRAKMREAAKKRGISPETREKINVALRGRKLTDEHKAAIGRGSRGRKASARQMANAMVNLAPLNPLAVARMTETKLRQASTPAGRARMAINLGALTTPKLNAAQVEQAKALRISGKSYDSIAATLKVTRESARRAVLGLGAYAA